MKSPTTLKRLIFESGQTQRAIAAKADVREDQFSRIVNGLSCDPDIQARIAEALGREVHELWPNSAAAA